MNKKQQDPETIKHERIKILPFVWKTQITNTTIDQNTQELEKIREKGENIQNSAKEYRNLSKELSKTMNDSK
tara:strand:+ start:6720 stop:6935 length:216 start_codon:yes stop_codon:yes gene_type:complete